MAPPAASSAGPPLQHPPAASWSPFSLNSKDMEYAAETAEISLVHCKKEQFGWLANGFSQCFTAGCTWLSTLSRSMAWAS